MKILMPADSYPEKYWLSYDHDRNLDHLIFRQCRKIEIPDKSMILYLKAKVSLDAFLKYDYFLSDGPSVASARLVEIIKSSDCDKCIQFVPVSVVINGKSYDDDFFIINHLFSEKAFDMSKSVYQPLIKSMPDGPKRFSKIVLLDKSPLNAVFRSEESKGYVVFSDSAADFLTAKKVKGMEFVSFMSGI